MARQQARRRHRERLAGLVLAVLGAVVLVVAIFALRQPKGHSNTAANSRSSSSVAKTIHRSSVASSPNTHRPGPSLSLGSSTAAGSGSASGAAHAVPLVVLNNTTTSGLAKQAADRFEAAGWTVTSYGNYQNDIVSTCAYYDPSDSSAKAAAEVLRRQFPTIKRVEPKFPELPSGPVVVVLTSDYSSG